MKTIRVGFMPLIDAAIPIAAVECGFAEREGLEIALVRETSWANIRDKLIHDLFDASHMLAPLAISTSLGIGNAKVPLAVPFGLNANGNCITLSARLYRAVEEVLGHSPVDARQSAQALKRVIDKRKLSGAPLINFAVVFPFSVHAIIVRHWLRLGGIDPHNDVLFQVVPPPFMVANLSEGVIDGCCVGEPWNSRAVESGVGSIVAFGADISRCAPDKVLALRDTMAAQEPEAIYRLLRAYRAAAHWCQDRENHGNLAHMLSQPQYLGVAPKTVLNALSGTLAVNRTEARSMQDFLVFEGDAINRPDPRKARWLYAEIMTGLRKPLDEAQAQEAAAVFRPDLFDAATGNNALPESQDPIGLKFGPAFDSDDLQSYAGALMQAAE
ncbi:MAG TPA: CmpA/NrtA family ABC transporter substrate-binding protein [Rhizomicrobium sp.]|nr:CmpA/NrtA family ABC transporter substrate-binding protein [Rhizomicrobium sp.]